MLHITVFFHCFLLYFIPSVITVITLCYFAVYYVLISNFVGTVSQKVSFISSN